MSCFVQYAPYHLADGTWDEHKEAFGDTVVNTIAEYAPNFKSLIRHRQVVTPLDLEREWGLSEGNIFQGELSLGTALLPAPGSRLGQLSHADPGPLHVRVGDASRRRHHGRARAKRRPVGPGKNISDDCDSSITETRRHEDGKSYFWESLMHGSFGQQQDRSVRLRAFVSLWLTSVFCG